MRQSINWLLRTTLLGLIVAVAHAQTPANVAGTYFVDETATISITAGGESDSVTIRGTNSAVPVTQNGTTFNFTVSDPSSGVSVSDTFTLVGNNVVGGSGPIIGFRPTSGLTVLQNQITSASGTVSQNRIDLTVRGQANVVLDGLAAQYNVTATLVMTVNVPPTPSAPSIAAQPQSQAATEGVRVTLSVGASGTSPLSYQWRKNGVPLAGANGALLTLANIAMGDAGMYDVVITNSVGSVVSSAATVTVRAFPPSPAVSWLQSAGGLASDYVRGVAVDGQGNCYITGLIGGSAQFGDQNIAVASASGAMYVAKYTAAGVLAWVRASTGSGSLDGRAIAVDRAGNCYCLASVTGTVGFLGANVTGSVPLTPGSGFADICVFKLDSLGNLVWTRQGKGNFNAFSATGIAVDGGGNCLVTSLFKGTVDFDSTKLVSASFDAAVAKYSSDGILVWARQIPNSSGNAVAADDIGNVYLTGYFAGPATISGTLYNVASFGNTIYTAKYDSTGVIQWFKLGDITARAFNSGTGIAVDAGGNCYCVGTFSGTIKFGTTTLVSQGAQSNLAVVKYGPSGAALWAKQATVSVYNYNNLPSVVADATGSCIVSGPFSGTASFDGIQLHDDGNTGFYITKFDPTGSISWIKQNTGGFWWDHFATALGPSGELYLASEFGGGNPPTFRFDGLVPKGFFNSDIFISKLDANVIAKDPGRLINLSILTSLADANDSFTMGTVIGGAGTSGTKPVLVRAAGPSLGALGVANTLADPKLEFFAGSVKVGENDDWGGTVALVNAFSQVGAFPFMSTTSKDAAIFSSSVVSGNNSVRVSGVGSAGGTVIAELYDSTPNGAYTQTTPRLINVSVLKQVGAGFTIGFVIGGSTTRTVLIRAVGPGLAAVGVGSGTVADPKLALFAGSTKIDENDNWGGSTTLTSAMAQVGAFAIPASSKDAALLATLQPGQYSVQVTGAAGASGVVIAEVYEVR